MDGRNASWCEGANLRYASVMIPQYISHADPSASPLVRYPGVPLDVAVTNYVGVAGVGLDAADYPAGNPKDGIFGYERETKPEEIKDGLDKTIALLQIPAGKTPWLAGGGATVRGVPEGPDAAARFACADYQGKHGTFAVMGDGKVRFIPWGTSIPRTTSIGISSWRCARSRAGSRSTTSTRLRRWCRMTTRRRRVARREGGRRPPDNRAGKGDAPAGWSDDVQGGRLQRQTRQRDPESRT